MKPEILYLCPLACFLEADHDTFYWIALLMSHHSADMLEEKNGENDVFIKSPIGLRRYIKYLLFLISSLHHQGRRYDIQGISLGIHQQAM